MLTKRSLKATAEDDECTEKKRRLEGEEKKRKAKESRGVRGLEKVNFNGMKKVGGFFADAGAAKATVKVKS